MDKLVLNVVFVLMLSWTIQEIQAHKVCDDHTPKAEVDESVEEIVKRLMSVRNPSWGWEFWSTAIVLQVSAPKMFFARQKSVFAFKRLISSGWDELEFFDKCEAAFVARALCLNPTKLSGRNLLNEINDKLGEYVNNTTSISPEDLIEFNFGLSSLCINGYPVDKNLVHKLLEMQNPDGSFSEGPFSSLATIWVMRPIFCLSRMKNTAFNQTAVKESVKKIRNYVINSITNITGQLTFGGYDFIVHDALVSLYKSMPENENVSKWYCNEVMKDVGIKPLDHEDEEVLTARLMTITGTDYLDLQNEDYKCLPREDLDKRPVGYKPICNYEKPETCGLPTPDDFLEEEEESEEGGEESGE
uniref:uncharacterized protein LOC120347206 n=1 Tax=Styela clava TaxID=7725 RepID=UPI00193A0830|nr:uncharacterized protein LOC120347206 [Styela clava]